jgi:LuxR family maltose regulon positive regulatory protein
LEEQFFHSNAPVVPGNQIYLERPHIHALMARAVKASLITVVAGAGYGKTHSVYSFLQSSSTALTIWLQITERDNFGWRFWENFTQGISLYNKGFAAKLAEIGFPATERQFDRYLTVPNEELKPDLKYFIVYDDFHLLHDKSVLRFVERSVNMPYRNVTSIIISRSEPAINTLPLLSKGGLVKITQEDLRFSREEVMEYFRLQGLHLNQGAAADIYRDTEGWAFAIHLVALALKNNPQGTGYARSSMKINVFKLIEGEIAGALPAALRKLLIKLSLIDHLSPELVREIAGDAGLVEKMEGIESFIRFDGYANTYHIHHLFLEYLSEKQGELSEEEKREVLIRAGRWCMDNGMKIAAVGYYEKAGAYDRIIQVVYTLPMLIPVNVAAFLLDILAMAPEELYEQSPIPWILHSRLLLTLGRIDEAAAEMRRVTEKFEALPPSAFNSRVLFGTYNMLGFLTMLVAMHRDRYDFSLYYKKAYEHFSRGGAAALEGPVTIACLGSYICRVGSAEKGKPEEFIAELAASIPPLMITMNGCAFGMDDLARCELAFFKGDLERAEGLGREVLKNARKRNQYEIENRTVYYLIRVNLALGNLDKIGELFKVLESELAIPEYSDRYIYYDIVSGWFYTQIGRPGKLAPWLKNDFEESELNALMLGLETTVRSKWYISEKRYATALASLESQENQYGMGAFLFGKILTHILEAVCRYRTGETENALRSLEAAYALAEPNGLYMSFVEMGKDMRALAGAALKEGGCAVPRQRLEKIRRDSAAYAKKIFAAAKQYREESRGPRLRTADLSRRELEVLTGLSRGLTREEIAEDKEISINTVKSVIKSIYNKLGAVNLADAIRLATAAGILKKR